MSKDAKKSVVLEAIEQWHQDQHAGERAVRRLEEQRKEDEEPAKQPEFRVLRSAMTLLYQAMVHMRSLGVKTGLGGIEQATSILEELEEIMQHSDAYEQGYKHGLVDGERQAHGVKPHGPRKKDESK